MNSLAGRASTGIVLEFSPVEFTDIRIGDGVGRKGNRAGINSQTGETGESTCGCNISIVGDSEFGDAGR